MEWCWIHVLFVLLSDVVDRVVAVLTLPFSPVSFLVAVVPRTVWMLAPPPSCFVLLVASCWVLSGPSIGVFSLPTAFVLGVFWILVFHILQLAS